MQTRFLANMHLHGGIPVVEIEGEWDPFTGQTLADMVSALMRAGHFDIIVNLTRMTRLVPLEPNCVEVLERIEATIRAHCGRLDVVGTVEQIQQYVRKQAQSRLFWATSEEQAVGRIKGLPVMRGGPILTVRLAR